MRTILARLVILGASCHLALLSPTARAQTSLPATVTTSEAQTRLDKALSQHGSINFTEVPLHQVVQKLSEQFNVQIVVSQKKLEEASVSVDTPITKQLNDLTLRSILKIILKDLELTYVIRDEVLSITTPEDAESQLLTRIYPVLDLVTPRNVARKADAGSDYDSLISVITATIQPDSWDDVGGPGAIDALDNAAALVVSQTGEVHEQIEGLLMALRKTKTLQGLAPPGDGAHRPTSLPANFTAKGPIETWQLPQVYGADR